jgi:hypothetical protein
MSVSQCVDGRDLNLLPACNQPIPAPKLQRAFPIESGDVLECRAIVVSIKSSKLEKRLGEPVLRYNR